MSESLTGPAAGSDGRVPAPAENAPSERLVRIDPEYVQQACRLFGEVFSQEAMSSTHWHWKYGEGRGRAIGLLRGDALVAHYGGVSRRLVYFGQPALACQICDVMVSKDANSNLQRRGPIYKVAATFIEREIGWGLPHLLGYGFPSARAFAVAQRQRLYTAVDSIVCASWPATALPQGPRRVCESLGGHGQTIEERQRRSIDRLWQRMAESMSHLIVGVRDAAWLQHRYLAHPTLRYEMLLLRRPWTRRVLGVVVTRAQQQHLEIIDLIAAPTDFPELITLARQRAAAAGLERVDCWISQSQLSYLSSIDAAALSVIPTGITVPANVHTAGPVDELRDHWFLLAGDADFT